MLGWLAFALESPMKLSSCPRCERHVLVESTSCPFCGTRLGTTSALGRAMMVMAVVGLSISCGGDDTTTESTVANTEGPTSQGPTSTTGEPETDAGGNDYAGPDTSISVGPSDSSDGGEDSTSSGGDTSSSGGDTSSGTDTGDTTAGSSSDGGGNDYAGAGVGPRQ
jgi:hypothetical protein